MTFISRTTILSTIATHLLLFTSCASVTHLKSQDFESNARKDHFPMANKLYFNSARSEKEGSIVEVGAWLVDWGNRKYFRYDIKVTNKTNDTIMSPDNIEVFDGKNVALRILSPEDAVYLAHGKTSMSALASSSAFQSAAAMQNYANPSPVRAYTYGNIYQTTPTSYTYSGTTNYQQQPNYAASMMSGMALGMALEAAQIQQDIAVNRDFGLWPTKLRPGSANVGRVYSLAGELPAELIISVAGEEHRIVLGKNSNTKGDRGGSQPYQPSSSKVKK
jgi:hypothetical protein